jgi:D-methionine transport system ATP-binding protein
MIKINQIKKSFISKNNSVHALNDISFDIQSGEVFGIVGKSGVGKSTLLNILSLSMLPDSGHYYLFGKDVTLLNSNEKKSLLLETSFIYQNFSLLYNLNVIDNVSLPLKLRGIDKITRYIKAKEMLSFVGLLDKANDYPITLSGGEAQRISIARALITNPKLLFLDEPTSALDDETAYDILNLIKKLHEEFKPTMILVSHQMQTIRYLCDRVMVLDHNKVKRIGPIQKHEQIDTSYDALWGDQK